jgi:serine/threonine protein kinase
VGSPLAALVPAASYTRVATIAQGGMGFVELVFRREGRFLRWCARKRLHEQLRNDPTFRSMFMDEARLAGLVRHPNAVGVLDVGEDDGGPFLIMDFVEGVPLSRLIAEAAAVGRLIPMQVVIRICVDTARGLHAAHEVRSEEGLTLGLVHRDVSPQNVLIGFDGTVRVTDFGIAKALGNATRTSAGVLKGNMGYLSPEQLRFEEADRRADFFSLGVTLYELLSGHRLYSNRDGFDGTRRILTEPPPDIGEVRSDVPPELCELLFELLAKDRESRPATAAEIASRLETMLAPLIGEEGLLTVGDYMRQHFLAASQEQRSMLAEHLKMIESAPVTSTKSLPPTAGFIVSNPLEALQPRRASTFRTITLGLVLGAGAAAGALYAINFRRPVHIHVLPSGKVIPTTAEEAAIDDKDEAAGAQTGLPDPSTAVVLPASTTAPAQVPVGAPVAVPIPSAAPVSADNQTAKANGDSQVHRPRRKLGKRTPRRARILDAETSPTTGPTHLAVPLFTRWQ